jgi:hypothetical protein
MGRARVETHLQEYRRSGVVTVRASVLKGVASSVGMILLAAFGAGMGVDAFQSLGASSLRVWGFVVLVLFCLTGALVCASPMVRGRRLVLTRFGYEVSTGRGDRRVRETGLGWEEVREVTVHRSSDGESSRTDVRIVLAPGGGLDSPAQNTRGYRTLPSGFAMSPKDLAVLMEVIRAGQARVAE